jgi:antitoxin CcdA
MRMKSKELAEGGRRYRAPAPGRKKATNVTVRPELLAVAERLGINLSHTLEGALVEAIRLRESERWLAENREALEEYNKYVEKYGVFSAGRRLF